MIILIFLNSCVALLFNTIVNINYNNNMINQITWTCLTNRFLFDFDFFFYPFCSEQFSEEENLQNMRQYLCTFQFAFEYLFIMNEERSEQSGKAQRVNQITDAD